MSSIREVAKKAKTSTATVSRVINQTGYVSDEMKKRVFEAIEALNYKPVLRDSASKRTKTIAYVTPDIENPFFSKMTKEIGKIAYKTGYNVMLISHDIYDETDDFLDRLFNSSVVGIIYSSSYRLEDVIRMAKEKNVPLVVMDRENLTTEIDSVSVNNIQAGYIATEHLISLGHKRIAFIGSHENVFVSDNRLKGYKKALLKYDIDYDESLVEHGNFLMQSGYEAAKRLLERKLGVTAMVIGNDLMAIGAVNYMNFKGYRVPRDISVIGFDDIELASELTPKLSSIAYPLERMSQLAIESILKQMARAEHEYESVILYSRLVERESTDKPSPAE